MGTLAVERFGGSEQSVLSADSQLPEGPDRAARMPPGLYERAFASCVSAMAVIDTNGALVEVNARFCELVGIRRDRLLASSGELRTDGDTRTEGALDLRGLALGRDAIRWTSGGGTAIIVEVLASSQAIAGRTGTWHVLGAAEVASDNEVVSQLTFQAFHDPLTGLANRMLFRDRLDHALARAARAGGGKGAVLLLDLDDFKGVNDSLGHQSGDDLLVAISGRLREQTRSSDTLCRLGGDEFLVLLEDVESQEEVERIAARIMVSIAEPFDLGGTSVMQLASLGIVPWSSGHEDPAQLVASADSAMYEAKRLGKGRHVVYDPEVRERSARRIELAQDLRGALEAGELAMYFQPLVELATHKVEGFEALMRWAHPTLGFVPPEVFIPIAEESDLILQLGELALRQATHEAMTWSEHWGGPPPYVSVNLSKRQLYDPHAVRAVEDALTRSGLPASRLTLEVTESSALGDLNVSSLTMQRLVQLGCRIAVDDFGTGYSSLSFVSLMYPKVIKVDASFVQRGDDDPDGVMALEGIVAVGHSLGATVVAEGIETAGHLESVRRAGCEVGQGFLFAPAVTAHDVVATARRIERGASDAGGAGGASGVSGDTPRIDPPIAHPGSGPDGGAHGDR